MGNPRGWGAGDVDVEYYAVGVPMAGRSPGYLEGMGPLRRRFQEDEGTLTASSTR